MMYVKYKLRNATAGLVVPKGPNFSRAKTTCCDIDGTLIQFKAPKCRESRYTISPILPKRVYKWDEMRFQSYFSKDFNVSDNWEKFRFFHNAWSFYGPWFTGIVATLDMYFNLVKPVNYKNNDFSLFHPRAFEKIVGDYLTNNYSTYKNKVGEYKDRHVFVAPVNWQPLQRFSTVAVRLEVIPDTMSVAQHDVEYFVFFALSDKVMGCIRFVPSQLLNLPQKERDKRISRSTMLELMNNIINSIEVTLSPEVQAQQKAALAGLDDTALVKTFAPLNWAEGRAGTDQNELPSK